MLDRHHSSHAAGQPLPMPAIDLTIDLLYEHLRRRPQSILLRLRLADALIGEGKDQEALTILEGLLDDLAGAGFIAMAIAVVRTIQSLDPRRADLEAKLAAMIDHRDASRIS